jgi:hypothetical protein
MCGLFNVVVNISAQVVALNKKFATAKYIEVSTDEADTDPEN